MVSTSKRRTLPFSINRLALIEQCDFSSFLYLNSLLQHGAEMLRRTSVAFVFGTRYGVDSTIDN